MSLELGGGGEVMGLARMSRLGFPLLFLIPKIRYCHESVEG